MIMNYKPSERVKFVEHSYDFDFDSNSGFTFPCDENGNIDESALLECALENLRFCRNNLDKFESYGHRVRVTYYRQPATGDCSCGNHIQLYDEFEGACQCEKCGRWYNLFGQELIPPEYWEEDNEPYNPYDEFKCDPDYWD